MKYQTEALTYAGQTPLVIFHTMMYTNVSETLINQAVTVTKCKCFCFFLYLKTSGRFYMMCMPDISSQDDPAEKKIKVLFVDNVSFQQAQEFHATCRDLNNVHIVSMLPENHTDKVQPLDAGYGKTIKQKIGEQIGKWLEKDENLETWHDSIPMTK